MSGKIERLITMFIIKYALLQVVYNLPRQESLHRIKAELCFKFKECGTDKRALCYG